VTTLGVGAYELLAVCQLEDVRGHAIGESKAHARAYVEKIRVRFPRGLSRDRRIFHSSYTHLQFLPGRADETRVSMACRMAPALLARERARSTLVCKERHLANSMVAMGKGPQAAG
jgi:hypothetical protein